MAIKGRTKHHIIRTVSKPNRKIIETGTESQQILKYRSWFKLITMWIHKLYLWKDMFNIPLFVYIFYCTSFHIFRLYNGATYASNVSMILLEHAMMMNNTFVLKLFYGCCSFAFVLLLFFVFCVYFWFLFGLLLL